MVVFVFYCESAIFMTLFLPQEGKMWKFLLQSREITFIGSIEPHSIYFVGITKSVM